MQPILEPYFTQTKQWSEFFIASHDDNHRVFEIDISGFATYVYLYPWYFGEKFLYIPSGPVLDNFSKESFEVFGKKLKELAVDTKACFIKFDLSPGCFEMVKNNLEDPIVSIKSLLNPYFKNLVKSRKRLMYISTIILDTKKLNSASETINITTLSQFYEENTEFFASINSGHRAKTKKSLTQNWQISTEKTEENFDHFWNIYQQTAGRQSFFTHERNYFHKLFKTTNSRIIILSLDSKTPEAVWFGYSDNNSLIYLYGGNTKVSMEKFGQYYIHLTAMMMAKNEDKLYYDLGGYDPNEGYGVFKERYKGQVIDFGGPYDIILRPTKYFVTENAIKTLKKLKTLVKSKNRL